MQIPNSAGKLTEKKVELLFLYVNLTGLVR
jgi:hypothetical protein